MRGSGSGTGDGRRTGPHLESRAAGGTRAGATLGLLPSAPQSRGPESSLDSRPREGGGEAGPREEPRRPSSHDSQPRRSLRPFRNNTGEVHRTPKSPPHAPRPSPSPAPVGASPLLGARTGPRPVGTAA